MSLPFPPRLVVVACLWLLLGSHLTATGTSGLTDLGQGLSYRRVQRLPADLPSESDTVRRCLVLDLRGASSEPGAASTLSAWLQFRSKPEFPTLVLVNSATDRAIRHHLHQFTWPGVITLGPSSLSPSPDLAIAVTAEQDAAACAALASGTSAEKLIAAPVDKPRRDEAQLSRAYSATTTESTREFRDPSSKQAAAAADLTLSPDHKQTTDALLERAVHLHRSLLALRRLPKSSG